MAGITRRFRKGERVEFQGNPVTILSVNRGNVTIRNIYGYKQDVKPKDLKRIEQPAR